MGLADMKNDIQALKDKQGINIEIGSIQNIVQTVINNYHLDNIVTEEQKEQLSGLMQDFSKLQLTEEQKLALKNFGESLVEKGRQLFEGLQSGFQSFQESGALQSLWDGIVGFFSNAWHWLTGLFS